MHHSFLHFPKELRVLFGIAIDDQGVSLELLRKHSELHEVSDDDGGVERVLQNLRIGQASTHIIDDLLRREDPTRAVVVTTHLDIGLGKVVGRGGSQEIHIPRVGVISFHAQLFGKCLVLHHPVLEVEEPVRILGVEFPEVFQALKPLLTEVLRDKGNDMEVVISRLVHNELLRRDKLERALEEVEDLLKQFPIEVVD